MKKKITHNEYLQLLGLFTLGARYSNKWRDIEEAIADLLNAKDPLFDTDHINDEMLGDGSLDTALEKMDIEVAPPKDKP